MKQTFSKDIKKYDKSNMLDFILNFSDQIKDAIDIGKNTNIEQPAKGISHVLVTGMGGSAIGGDIFQKLFSVSATVPCNVIRDYRIPAWANRNTLVIVVSFSGNTEETVSAYEAAISKGCPCIVSSGGGKVLEIAKKEKHQVIQIPGGRPPRTALGYLFFPLFVNFVKWGFIKSSLIDYEELFEVIEKMAEKNDPTREPNNSFSFKVAQDCLNRIPIFYTSAEMEAIGRRWKSQICENSKVLAFYNSFPEMNHNEIVGWQRAAEMNLNDQLFVFFIRDRDDHPKVQKRMDIVRELINQSVTPVQEIYSEGESLLARIFFLLYLADFVSFNLAILNKEDPTPIENIDYLKFSLNDSSSKS